MHHYHIVISKMLGNQFKGCVYVIKPEVLIKLKITGKSLPSAVLKSHSIADEVLSVNHTYDKLVLLLRALLSCIEAHVYNNVHEPPCIHNHTVSHNRINDTWVDIEIKKHFNTHEYEVK